jgi:hypothetical protein
MLSIKQKSGLGLLLLSFSLIVVFQNCGPSFDVNSPSSLDGSSDTKEGGALTPSVLPESSFFSADAVRSVLSSDPARTRNFLGPKEKEIVRPSVSSPLSRSNRQISSEKNGHLYRIKQNGSEHYLMVLKGTPYQMGYAHGALVPDEIVDYVTSYRSVYLNKAGGNPIPFQDSQFQSHIPERYRDEIQGIVDGVNSKRSGSVTFVDILALQFELELAGFGCTAFTLKGSKTQNGQTLVSRSLDWSDHSSDKSFIRTQMIVSYQPPGGSSLPHMVSLSRAGLVGVVTAFTDSGAYAEINYSGVEKMPVRKVGGQVYPHMLLAREIVESFTKNSPPESSQAVKTRIQNRIRQAHQSALKPVHAAQYLFAYDDGRVSYSSVIEGMGTYDPQAPFLRESESLGEKIRYRQGKAYKKSNVVVHNSPEGLLLLDENSLYKVQEVSPGELELIDLLHEAQSVRAPVHVINSAPARILDIFKQQPASDALLGAWFDHSEEKHRKVFQITQHGYWGVQSLQNESQGFTGSHYSIQSNGFISLFKTPEGHFRKEGVWINAKLPGEPLYGRLYLEPQETSTSFGLPVTKGQAYISILQGSERSPLGSYTQIGNLMVQGTIGNDPNHIWVTYNPDYVDQEILLNVNNWFLFESLPYTNQLDFFGQGEHNGLDRYFRGILYMSSLNRATKEQAFERLIKLYQETQLFPITYNYSNPVQSGAVQMSTVNVKTGEAIISFARVQPESQRRGGFIYFDNAYEASVMPIEYKFAEFFE